ncbi:hypothetical protein PtA15_7A813 [Puccinia triticina]|uniref:UBX domain-containing protein n=1 Tax=Puccinia triticina TaxID=208348 RepID=A0ABY7CPA2_9BASI|nr:uncharacterized protein PtA15_7A813 [Puccinia triticina]WAQ87083.1 hypothetical protein PtA15_7A813 [Puccinia triticina]
MNGDRLLLQLFPSNKRTPSSLASLFGTNPDASLPQLTQNPIQLHVFARR